MKTKLYLIAHPTHDAHLTIINKELPILKEYEDSEKETLKAAIKFAKKN